MTYYARDDVNRLARGKSDDDAHRPRRIRLQRLALLVPQLRAFHHSTNIGSGIDSINELEVGEDLPRCEPLDFLLGASGNELLSLGLLTRVEIGHVLSDRGEHRRLTTQTSIPGSCRLEVGS